MKPIVAALLGAMILWPMAAEAAGSCTSITTPAIGFGAMLNPGSTNVTTLTMMSASCTAGTSYTIFMDVGLHASGTGMSARRNIANGPNLLPYDIFSDAAHTVRWGDGVSIGSGVATSGTGSSQQFPIYSLLSVPLTTLPGVYTDSVTVTLSF